MLCTSYAFTPLHRTPTRAATAVEVLCDVYLCASCPVVTEEWGGCPELPYVRTASGQTQPILTHLEVSLPMLLQSYRADVLQRGASFLQVLAIGTHHNLSEEAKAMVAGATMCAMRARLLTLLLPPSILSDDHPKDEDEELNATYGEGLRELLHKWCRFIPGSTTSSSTTCTERAATSEKRVEGTWQVTWSHELLHAVAAAYAPASTAPLISDAPVMVVTQCREMLRTSVELGLRARLWHDMNASSSHTSHANESVAGSGGRTASSTYDSMTVQLTACAAVHTHPLDVQRAMDLGVLLYTAYLCPAQELAEDGTDAFTQLLRLPTMATQHGEGKTGGAEKQWEALWLRALRSYHDSAVYAQRGVSFILTHEVSLTDGGSLMPLHPAEERARVQVALLQSSPCVDRGAEEAVLAPLRVRSAGAYLNNVVLVQHWAKSLGGDGGDGRGRRSTTAKAAGLMEGSDGHGGSHSMAPARAALCWRVRLASRMPQQAETKMRGATLQPTPLQWVLYSLRRQLVVVVANTAQVMLTGHRLRQRTRLSLSASAMSRLSDASLRAQAVCCVKAQGLLRGLLLWHCPYPPPPQLTTPKDGEEEEGEDASGTRSVLSTCALDELLWCLRLLAKLHLRAAALFGCVGDEAHQHEQLRQWQDQLQRWESRRKIADRQRALQAERTGGEGVVADAWRTSVESVVGHVGTAAWATLLQEVSVGLPSTR